VIYLAYIFWLIMLCFAIPNIWSGLATISFLACIVAVLMTQLKVIKFTERVNT